MVSRVGRWRILGPRLRGRLQPGDVVRAELRDQVRREQLERAQVRVDGHAMIRVPRVETLLAQVLHQPHDRAVTPEVATRLQLGEATLDVVEGQASERDQRRRVQLADAATAQLRRGHDPAELRRRRHGQEVPLVGPVLGDRAVSHPSPSGGRLSSAPPQALPLEVAALRLPPLGRTVAARDQLLARGQHLPDAPLVQPPAVAAVFVDLQGGPHRTPPAVFTTHATWRAERRGR
jgi:hypothetical protein